MKVLPLVLIALFSLASVSGWAKSSAFDLSGTLKTFEKDEKEGIQRRRGEIQVEEDSKILEMNIRRMNPTVAERVTIRYAVFISDMRGAIRPITKGEQTISVPVGIPTQLESDSFTVTKVSFESNREHGSDGRREQKIEGYAIIVLDTQGNEISAKFQPKSLEEKARQVIVGNP